MHNSQLNKILSIKEWLTINTLAYVIFVMFCIIGCIWHICSISQVFFAYPTTVSVTFQSSNQIGLPSVTLCGVHEITIKRSKIKSTSPWKEEIAKNPNKESQVYERIIKAIRTWNFTEFGSISKLNDISTIADDVISRCEMPIYKHAGYVKGDD